MVWTNCILTPVSKLSQCNLQLLQIEVVPIEILGAKSLGKLAPIFVEPR
jgi:hypothetical protein